ncbi:hypothetical protein ACULNC_06645 [Shigella flexneri]
MRAEKRATPSARKSPLLPVVSPPDLASRLFDRLDADIAHALMSINAVKGAGNWRWF